MDPLPEYDEWLALMEEAERGDGWLAWCESRGIYIGWTPPLIAALGGVLRECAGAGAVIEIAAGDATLARCLADHGLAVRPTDPQPRGTGVERLSCQEALEAYSPEVVLSCFAPLDAGIEERITAHPAVRHYLYIGPLIHDRPGPDGLWKHPGWLRAPLPEADRFLISRLDYLSDFSRRTHRRRASALLLSREAAGYTQRH